MARVCFSALHLLHLVPICIRLAEIRRTSAFLTVITVKYGVTNTVVRCNLTSTVRTVQIVIVPYRTTRQA